MIHFDVNVLVYAFRIESPDHDRCRGVARRRAGQQRRDRSWRARAHELRAASWRVFYDLAANDPQIRANLVPDAWLAALAISHDARLATTDRGFARFPGLELVDPRTKS